MVSGRAGVGKTTFSKFCIEYLGKKGIVSEIFPFAYGVKAVAKSMGWDGEKDAKGRRLLQAIGSSGREYNPDIWADITIRNIKNKYTHNAYLKNASVVCFVDDWRFPNEGNVLETAFGDKNVCKVRIYRPEEFHLLLGTPLYNDSSETSLPEFDDAMAKVFYDVTIQNLETLEVLQKSAKIFCDYMILK
jgi:hypothetical protein